MNRLFRHSLPVALLATAACTTAEDGGTSAASTPAAAPGVAYAQLTDAAGQLKGRATVRPMGDGVHVDAVAENMAAGTYAIHLHQVGQCTPPGFESAGSHWNPTARQHGSENPNGPHKGDLPNLTIGADGRGSLSSHISGASMADLLDADGAAIVVHAKADDYKTDPSGNSGARIACGVLSRG